MTDAGHAENVREPLAVVGLSCLFPKAAHVAEFWANIRDGVDAITEIPPTHWNADEYFDADPKSPDRTYARRGGFLSAVEFDPLEFGIAPSNLEAIDTSQLLGLVAAKRALEDAGYGRDRQYDRSRVGCILGVTGTLEMVIPLGARLGHPKWRKALKDAGVADDVADDVIQRIGDSYVSWQENSFPGLLGNVVAGRIANRLDLGGTNCVVDAACASSLSAMHLAALELWSGRSDMVVTGGVDTFNDIFMYLCFSKTPALSPTGNARPFSEDGDGTILGEGIGMFVLKRLADAQRDGDKIQALIRGIGTSSDGAGNAVYAPKKDGQVRCLQDAYRLAGVSPETVELIEAHGTGTKVGDATELAGLSEVFHSTGKTGRWCAVGSIKSQIGHTKAAAGAAGVLKAILALKHQVLPPTIKIDRPLPELLDDESPLYAIPQARPWLAPQEHPRRAGVSAFGFGGSNFHCVLEESPANPAEIDWSGDLFFAALSADSHESLSAQLADWQHLTDRDALRRQAALSRQRFQSSHEHRLVIVADFGAANVSELIARARESLKKFAERTSWSTPDGIYYCRGPRTGKLGLLFPGQGSQYVEMQRELACRFPKLRDVLGEANEIFASFSATPRDRRLSDYLYPIPAFDDRTREQQEAVLRDTEIAQPALGAISLGMLAVLSEFGVTADVVAGHSYGELTALCASKRFAPEALYRLSMLRGRLMAEAQEIEGGMLAVGAPLSQVEAALKESAVDLVIANRNSPTQVVLSGRIAELDRATEVFARRNIRGKRLPVAAAFHSPLVAAASQRFRPVLDEIEFFDPEIPVYGNSLAEEYPDDHAEARSLLAGQLAQPVEFVRQVENMYAAGVRTFLEVGPGAVLTGLVNSILSGSEFRAIAVDSSSGKRHALHDLALAVGQLAVAGCAVNLAKWDPSAKETPSAVMANPQRMTIPICGANYVKPRTPRPPRVMERQEAQGARPEAKAFSPIASNQAPPTVERRAPAAVSPTAKVPAPSPARPAPNPQPATYQPHSSNLFVLQQMFEQTARLHQQFLTGQEQTLQTLERLAGGHVHAATVVVDSVPLPKVMAATSVDREAHAEVESLVDERPTTDNGQQSELTSAVLTVVAEKTGYPVEMLKPEMSLDHDLGIDSIKRVEILSAVQERRPDLPAVKPEQLGTLHRLADVIELLGASTAREARADAVASDDSQPSTLPAQRSDLTDAVLAVVAEKTGYPVEMLKPEMSLDHDLGIDSIKRVEILSAVQERRPDLPAVKPEQLGTLHRLADVIELLGQSTAHEPPATGRSSLASQRSRDDAQPATILTVGAPRSVSLTAQHRLLKLAAGARIVVTDDGSELSRRVCDSLQARGYQPQLVSWNESHRANPPGNLGGLILIAPQQASDHSLWHALEWAKRCGPALRQSGKTQGAFLATISRLDGQFGFSRSADVGNALSGALAGLAKTVRHEWPEVTSTAFDVSAESDWNHDLIERFVDCLLSEGPPEIGITADEFRQIEVADQPIAEHGQPPIQPGDVLLITGGARGVTAACALAVARAWQPHLVLCGRTPLEAAEPDWLSELTSAAQIKQALSRHAAPGTSLKQIDQQCRQVLANREVRSTLNAIRAAGTAVDYVALDIRDQTSVREAVDQIQRPHGLVRGVIHGAGVLEDRRIEDKTREQFDHVFSTKVTGLQNLLENIDPRELRCLAMFSSYTGRFGRTGQVDYAMANEVLNKLAAQFQRRHPQCRVRSFNWGPWDGGMVTDSLKPLFAKEGVGLIPLAEGADLLVRELERPEPYDVEVVVLAKQGREARGERREDDATNRSPSDSKAGEASANSQLVEVVLEVVAEKTGYPVEMLVPSMSLDHDLGIDSIKRVEILSALQERRPDLPAVKPEQLGTLHRLEDVIELLGASRAREVQAPAASISQPTTIVDRSTNRSQPSAHVTQPTSGRIGWERTVDLQTHPYLASHVIGGKAVFPTAMIVECLAHAALHHHPGLELLGLANLRIFKGVRLDRDERLTLQAMTEKALRVNGDFQIPARLISSDSGRDVLHAQAEISLGTRRSHTGSRRLLELVSQKRIDSPDSWYERHLFHGPQLQGLERVEMIGPNGIVVWSKSATPPSQWMSDPWRGAWLADPLAIDVMLQAIIVWTQTVCQRASLPTAIAGYRQFRRYYPNDGVRIAVSAERKNEATVLADAEILDAAGQVVAEFIGIEYVLDAQLSSAFQRNRLE